MCLVTEAGDLRRHDSDAVDSTVDRIWVDPVPNAFGQEPQRLLWRHNSFDKTDQRTCSNQSGSSSHLWYRNKRVSGPTAALCWLPRNCTTTFADYRYTGTDEGMRAPTRALRGDASNCPAPFTVNHWTRSAFYDKHTHNDYFSLFEGRQTRSVAPFHRHGSLSLAWMGHLPTNAAMGAIIMLSK